MKAAGSRSPADELAELTCVHAWSPEPALLAASTRHAVRQIESKTARRLEKAGLLVIDAGAGARLSDAGHDLIEAQ